MHPADASAVLRAAVGWQLREPRWRQVRAAVDGIRAAFAAADVKSAWQAIAQLEQLGPLRVATRLGDPPKQPAPEDVRERVNELIDELVRRAGQDPSGSGHDADQGHGTPSG